MDSQKFILVGHGHLVEYATHALIELGHSVVCIVSTDEKSQPPMLEQVLDDDVNLLVLNDNTDWFNYLSAISTEKIFFLNPLVEKFIQSTQLNTVLTSKLGYIWKKKISGTDGDKHYRTVQIDLEDYIDGKNFFIDALYQLAIQIAREEIILLPLSNVVNSENQLTFNLIDRDIVDCVGWLTAICAAFSYKFFNLENLIFNSALAGSQSYFYDEAGLIELNENTLDVQNKTISSLVPPSSILPRLEEWSNFHLAIPLLIEQSDRYQTPILNLGRPSLLCKFSFKNQGQLQVTFISTSTFRTSYDYDQLKTCFYSFVSSALKDLNQNIELMTPLTIEEQQKFLSAYCSGTSASRKFPLPNSRSSVEITSTDNLYLAFESAAHNNADRIALRYGEKVLTYKQLLTEIDQLSNYLSSLDLKAGYIGVYFTPCFEFIISIFAIMKAGHAYLPLEKKWPIERSAELVRLSGTKLILTNETGLAALEALNDIQKVNVNEIRADKVRSYQSCQKEANPIAYLIYTSGSTGIPKGVMCTHVGALNMIKATIEVYPVENDDRLLLLASCAFDISVWEIFCPLLIGAELILPLDDIYSDPRRIVQAIEKYQITMLHMVPTVLKYFVKFIDSSACSSLKHIVSGGEELTVDTAQSLLSILPKCRLYHGYGPTEAAITSLHHIVQTEDLTASKLPIGTPLPFVQIAIVNKQNQLLPFGVEGELLISGPGLAVGYLNNAEKTTSSFIELKFNDGTNNLYRFYKTGDLVKMHLNHLVEYIGRLDNQIKIYGNRVELEEIERNIMSLLDVDQAIVIANTEGNTTSLLAFLILENTASKAEECDLIKQKLKLKLPNYMQPSQVIFIEQIPRLSSGKIDRKKLLDTAKEICPQIEFPSNVTELKICNYLTTLTGIEQISININLFELGFNSLLITQLSAFIDAEFGIRLSPYCLSVEGTIAKIAALICNDDGTNTAQQRPIQKVSRTVSLPLSHAQKRLWFVHQLEDQKSHAYNIINVYKIQGDLNIPCLEKSIASLIARHESLRTLFKNSFGTPHQIILQQLEFSLDVVEINESNLDSWLRSFCSHEFQLDAEVSVKFRLLHVIDKNDFVLVLLQHNIITDGWSTGVLIRDLSNLYCSHLLQKPSDLSELKIQYVDFAIWQNHLINENLFVSQIDYWSKKLANFHELDFPLSYPRQAKQTFNGQTVEFNLDEDKLFSINQFIKTKHITLYSYLVSALNLLLYGYCDQRDIVIGSAAANRGLAQIKDIMGFFVNIFPIRTYISENSTVEQLIDATTQSCMEAISNQDIPFDILVDKLKIEREPNRPPIFQLLFLMQDAADNMELIFNHCRVEPINLTLNTSIYDMTFNVFKAQDTVTINCQYNSDLFSKEFIEQFICHYKNIIEELYALSEHAVDQFDILSAADYAAIKQCNKVERYVIKESFLTLFSKSAQVYPTNIALLDGHQALTYLQLDAYTHLLSQLLPVRTAENQEFIGIILPKSTHYVAVMIAIMKSGHVYVPLDPDIPMERMDKIITSANIKYIVTDSALEIYDGLCAQNINIIDIQGVYCSSDHRNTSSNKPEPELNQLVYAIFTSGSTGTPKGVKISNLNLVNALLFFKNELDFSDQSRFLSLTSPTFDIFQLECLLPLTTGGSCYLTDVKNDFILNITQYNPTHIQATPSTWKLILEHIADRYLDVTAIVGGEALELDLLIKLQPLLRKILNAYGPTETTIWSCVADLTQSDTVNIGKPIANTSCYVLNSRYQPVPIHCTGKLIIGGDGVSQGYINQALNTGAFINQKIGDLTTSNETFYNTGDYVRLLKDGNIKYLGRMDEQVKIRGHRIELLEITHTIKQCQFVKDAVTIAIAKAEHSAYEKILIAFVILSDGFSDLDAIKILAETCETNLPRYMLPNSFVPIKNIPMNNRGKIDNFALKKLYVEYAAIDNTIRELTRTEMIIADVWKEILNLPHVSTENTFYNLGGHSLLIPVMLAKLMKKFGIPITIREFIQYPTIQSLARYIDTKTSSNPDIIHTFAQCDTN